MNRGTVPDSLVNGPPAHSPVAETGYKDFTPIGEELSSALLRLHRQQVPRQLGHL